MADQQEQKGNFGIPFRPKNSPKKKRQNNSEDGLYKRQRMINDEVKTLRKEVKPKSTFSQE
jgi:hypothetical protein